MFQVKGSINGDNVISTYYILPPKAIAHHNLLVVVIDIVSFEKVFAHYNQNNTYGL